MGVGRNGEQERMHGVDKEEGGKIQGGGICVGLTRVEKIVVLNWR